MLELAVTEFSHSEVALFHAANVMMLCDCFEKSKTYVHHLLSEYPSSVDGYLIKGWLELKDNKLKSARNCFKAVLSQVICFFNVISVKNSMFILINIRL